VERLLHIDPKLRYQSADELMTALSASRATSRDPKPLAVPISSAPSFAPPVKLTPIKAASGHNSLRQLYALLVLVILTAIVAWVWLRPAVAKPVLRYSLAFDSAEAMSETVAWGDRMALSSDGSRLAYIGGPRSQLLIRSRNELHGTAMPGTEGATSPFFSPDGESVGFVVGNRLLIASLGGPPITVTHSLVGEAGLSWGRDGFIYADGAGAASLVRVEAKPEAVPTRFTVLDTTRGEADHLWPEVLPNGKGVLFTIAFSGKNAVGRSTSHAVAVADVVTGKHRVLVYDAIHPRYAAPGYLLYVTTNRTLMVVAFDQRSLKVSGQPKALSEGLRLGAVGSADLAVSTGGTLMYSTGVSEIRQELTWVTRDGKAQSFDSAWHGQFESPAISPDGTRLAVVIQTADKSEVWVRKLSGEPGLQLTIDGKINPFSTWTTDGRSVTFTSNVAGSYDLWTKRADGSAQAVLQLHQKLSSFEPLWSPDGKWLIFRTRKAEPGAADILAVRPGVDTAPVPLVATAHSELSPTLSPDGRWMAYVSDESGNDEVYVVPFPNTTAAKWAVSTHGGTGPLWSPRGGELFYRDEAGNMVAVEVQTAPAFALGRSTALFSAARFVSDEQRREYAVAPDARRFLMVRPLPASPPDKVTVVENWFEELKPKRKQ
jgi:serine/threonine-protein kinase